jgi:uncharacterized protein YecE (DUF72 family)
MKNHPQFKIGCSGFYNRHWKGIFYPEKLPQSQWLNFYCEHFNSVELNVTFYRFPTAQMMQEWYRKSPDDFLFSVKAPKLITHFKKFNDCNRELNDFYFACEDGLEHKLGCVLFQLPPGIHYSEEKLEQVISGLKPGFKNVIEFRHKSWWKKNVYDELAEHGITFCSVSHPTLPETIVVNSSTVYIRLHGNQKMFFSDYSTEELKQLSQAILKKRKIKEAFIYFNNTAGTAGVLNAGELKNIVQEKN